MTGAVAVIFLLQVFLLIPQTKKSHSKNHHIIKNHYSIGNCGDLMIDDFALMS